jgi:hypothetical protein
MCLPVKLWWEIRHENFIGSKKYSSLTNKDKYRFSDFTLENYGKLLKLALENYKFILFTDNLSGNLNSKKILLRHDIEFSVPIALRMAQIEESLGIRSTYFLQIHSEFYNPLEKENYDSIKKIIKKGHILGLHFDSHFWRIKTENDLEKYIAFDKNIIETYFEVNIKVLSFHNTNDFVLSCENENYAELINVYSKRFKTEVGYCTDSTGYWRYERLEDRMREAKDEFLQILIHDGMWQDEALPPRQRIFKVIDNRAEYLKFSYDSTLRKFGAKNIDWDKIY